VVLLPLLGLRLRMRSMGAVVGVDIFLSLGLSMSLGLRLCLRGSNDSIIPVHSINLRTEYIRSGILRLLCGCAVRKVPTRTAVFRLHIYIPNTFYCTIL